MDQQLHVKQPEENLAKYLKMLPRDREIKLGANESAGFFWFGTARDLLNDIDFISRDAKGEITKKAKAAEKSVADQIRAIPTISEYLALEWRFSSKGMDRTPKFSIDDYVHYVTDKVNKMRSTAKNYKKVQDYLDNWVSIEDRKVYDHYQSLTENAEIVIIEGMEPGPWWDKEEKRKYPKGKKIE